jgi:hypothetical protein
MAAVAASGSPDESAFSPDYATARRRFIDAAGAAGARIESIRSAARGPSGEALDTDIAVLGPALAECTVIVSSGLHGVEGFPGSAIQLAWLQRQAGVPVANGVTVVLVHALNPFGFAWLRRTNEHNVDLNRNFVMDRSFLDSAAYRDVRDRYERMSAFLNPASPPSRREPYLAKVVGHVLAEGFEPLRRSLPVGQYHRPEGLFYGGGPEPEPETTVLRELLTTWTRTARLAVHLDIHSGLGRWAECQMIVPDAAGSPAATWAVRAFGSQVTASGDGAAYRAHGTMIEDFQTRALPCEYHGLTAEFGTYSGIRVLGVLRAENRAHFFAARGSPADRRARRALREAFVPSSRDWRSRVVRAGLANIDRAIAVCAGSGPV